MFNLKSEVARRKLAQGLDHKTPPRPRSIHFNTAASSSSFSASSLCEISSRSTSEFRFNSITWILVVLLCVTSWATAEDDPTREDWYLVKLQSQGIGYMHEAVWELSGKHGLRFQTVEELILKFKRMDQELDSSVHTRILEGANGNIIDFDKTQKQGTDAAPGPRITTRGYVTGDEIVIWSGSMERRVALSREVLGPAAKMRRVASLPLKPGSWMEVLAFSEDSPEKPGRERTEVLGREMRPTLHGDQDLWKLRRTTDLLPGINLDSWVDDRGHEVVSVLPFGGFGDLEMFQCSKDEALQPISGAEVFKPSVIIPNRALDNYQDLHEARYHLTSGGKLSVFSGSPEQKVAMLLDNEAMVRVTIPNYQDEPSTWRLPIASTSSLQPFLAASTYLEIDDHGIQDLAHQAVGSERHPLRAARKIEAFVRSFITKKDFGVGFDSAAEIVKSRHGDCKQHAVLAAALGRVVGLPTRVVAGLGYLPPDPTTSQSNSPGTFAFHMWAEACIGTDQWVAMDPALGGFDVGHIAFARSDLNSSMSPSDLVLPILQSVGQLKVDIESAR